MNDGTRKVVNLVANVALIIVAVLLCAVIGKDYFAPRLVGPPSKVDAKVDAPSLNLHNEVQPGERVSLSGVDWSKSNHTLLLAISSKCNFCSESASFYQRLAKERDKIQLVAVLPQSTSEGQAYLESLKVSVDDIRHASLFSLGVKGTPTLILVDGTGRAIKSWLGKLDASQEADVMSSL